MKQHYFSFEFLKSQISAIVATGVDFLILLILVELFAVWYVVASAIAAFCGAVTNFVLGRHWAFLSHDDRWHHQAQRYALVATGSLILNTLGIFLLTDGLEVHYFASKVIVSLFLAVSFNFPLQKFYVFKAN